MRSDQWIQLKSFYRSGEALINALRFTLEIMTSSRGVSLSELVFYRFREKYIHAKLCTLHKNAITFDLVQRQPVFIKNKTPLKFQSVVTYSFMCGFDVKC